MAASRRPSGTATIRGRVYAGDTGRPLVRARVRLFSSDLPNGLVTLTDQSGAYVFTELPAGSYTVTASKTAFVDLAYGASGPTRRGKRVTVAQGQQVQDIDLRLPRGGVISGRIYDDTGEPIVRGTIRAMRYQYAQGEPRLVSVGGAESDDRGQFRIFGLTPGSYVVMATARSEGLEGVPPQNRPAGDTSTGQSFAPIYYPGVASLADAAPIVLGAQQEHTGTDFVMQLVPAARVSGTVVSDAPFTNAMVLLALDDPRGVASGSTFSGRVQDDGTFVVSGVTPGRYNLVARAMAGTQASRSRSQLIGLQPVTVAGEDLSGLSVQISSGGTVSGVVVFESSASQRTAAGQVRLSVVPPTSVPFVSSQAARVQADGSFTIPEVVAGLHLLRLDGSPRGWTLKGIYLNGRDITDTPVEVRNNQTTGGIHVVLTDRVSELTGRVLDERSEPVADCYIVAFSTDSASWYPRSRAIQGVRADQSGNYRFTGLPPGEYFLVAIDEIEPGSWYEPSVLEALKKEAARVAIAEGETKSLDVKVAGSW